MSNAMNQATPLQSLLAKASETISRMSELTQVDLRQFVPPATRTHPLPDVRNKFAKLARDYIAACDGFSTAIHAAAATPSEETDGLKRLTNSARRRAYDALVDAAVLLARAEGRA